MANESEHAKQERERTIELCRKHGMIGPLDDGFQYFWIENHGAYSAFNLRAIADELDRLNKPLEDQIKQDAENGLFDEDGNEDEDWW